MKTYTIVGGVNGCGKSSWTGVLCSECSDLEQMIDEEILIVACGGNWTVPRASSLSAQSMLW